jgi:hypothetical protein
MPNQVEDEEIEIESRTQSAEAITKVLEGDNYAVTKAEDLTDKLGTAAPVPEPETAPPAPVPVPVPPPATTPASEAPSAPATPATPPPEPEPVFSDAELAAVPETDQHGKKLSGAQRAKQAKERLRRENEELRERVKALEAKPTPAPVLTPAASPSAEPDPDASAKPKPDPNSFTDGILDVAYQEALVDWKLDERARLGRVESKRKAQEDSDKQAEEARKAAEATWSAQVSTAKEKFTDYDEVMKSAMSIPLSNAVAVASNSSTMKPQVLYWLATHTDENSRILELTHIKPEDSPRTQARKLALAVEEVEKIEAKLAAPAASAAPPPETPVPAPAAGGNEKPPVPVKPTPAEPVRARSGTGRKKLSELNDAELRALDTPEYTQLYREQYGRNPY